MGPYSDYNGYIGMIPEGTTTITIKTDGTDFTPNQNCNLGYIANGEYRSTPLNLSMNADNSEGEFNVPEGAISISIFGEIFEV